jgi:hypothetical protein
MNIKLGKYLAVLPMLSLLVACAQLGQLEAQHTDSGKIVQNAKTYSDHNNLANYYDKLAEEMAVKAEEKKESLEEYEDHSYYYGRQGQDFKSHTQANIRYYEEEAAHAVKQADFHRKIAAELLQREYAKSDDMPDQALKIKARLDSNSESQESVRTQ